MGVLHVLVVWCAASVVFAIFMGFLLADCPVPSKPEQSVYGQGQTDGMIDKVSSIRPSTYVMVGKDEYAQGYRAGYFGRTAFSSSALS